MVSVSGRPGFTIFLRWVRKYLPFILIFCGPGSTRSQELASMKFDVLDQSQGLSGYWITDIALDSSGFVWVGTREGLNRFDGYTIKTFRHNDHQPNSLKNDHGQSILVQDNGTIWISYKEGGISKYREDCQCFQHMNIPGVNIQGDFDAHFGIRYIAAEGNVWFSGNGLGLNIYNPSAGKTDHYDLPGITQKVSATDQIENNTVNYVYREKQGLYWLAAQQGLYSFDASTKKFTYFPFNEENPRIKEKASFNKLIPEGDKGFWVSSWEGGLNYFDRKTGLFTNYLFEKKAYGYYNLIYDLAEKNGQELYIVSGDRGLGIFNKVTGRLEFNKKLQNRLNPDITFLTQMLKLPSGVIFLADENALLRYNPAANRFVFKSLKVSSSQHGDLFSIRKIQKWPGTEVLLFAADLGNGLNIINPATGKQTALPIEANPERDPKLRIRNLLFDSTKRLWVITRDYLYYMDHLNGPLRRVRGYTGPETGAPPEYLQGYKDRNGNIWVLLKSGTLHRLNPTTGTLDQALGIGNGRVTPGNITHVAFTKHDELWIVSDGKLSMVTLEGTHAVSIRTVNLGNIRLNEIKGMQSDKDGHIWIALNRLGILKVWHSKMQFKRIIYTRKDGLPDILLYGLGVDPNGKVWVPLLSGVVRFDPLTGRFEKFSHNAGMEKFTVSMNFFQTDQGDFYITSLSKYCRVDPVQTNLKPEPPDIYLNAFRVFEEDRQYTFASGSAITVAPGEDFFSFDFGCRDFGDQSTHRFYYMLDGWDKTWVPSGTRRHAGYTNLPEGKYTFRVRVITEEGLESKTLSVPLKIQTHFYKKGWFQILSALVFAILIFILYLLRIRRIRKAEALRSRLNNQIGELRMEAMRSQMNPHFIFNSLNSINRYIIKNDPKTSSLYLTRFASLMRMVLDNSRHKTITLERELQTLQLYIELEAFRFDKKFSWDIHVDPVIDTSSIEVPPLIIQPFVENAIWHGLMKATQPGNLQIQVRESEGILVVEVSDNGIGRKRSAELKADQNPAKTSHGQDITKERIRLINQDFLKNVEITDLYDESGNAAGTRVSLYINCLND